jgi:DNA processing protein
MIDKEILPWIALQAMPMLGIDTKCRLLRTFGPPEKIFGLSGDALARASLNSAALEAITGGAAMAAARRIYRIASETGMAVITLEDSRYPALLKEIPNPPPAFFAYGRVEALSLMTVAVIGSRRPSGYGRQMTARLAGGLAKRGLAVVSGMARGLDSMAHRSVLESGGVTAAVLGSGLGCPYPAENTGLMKKIMARGCVISEYPPDTPPLKRNFPERNRLISGLSLAVVVVEASEKSGSLITASLALEQGRDVFAVAGNVTSPLSRGTNSLIKSGAVPVETASDVLENLFPGGHFIHHEAPAGEDDLTDVEKSIINYLAEAGECQINDLSGRLGMPVEEMMHYLLCLELKKKVRQRPGQVFEMKVI